MLLNQALHGKKQSEHKLGGLGGAIHPFANTMLACLERIHYAFAASIARLRTIPSICKHKLTFDASQTC